MDITKIIYALPQADDQCTPINTLQKLNIYISTNKTIQHKTQNDKNQFKSFLKAIFFNVRNPAIQPVSKNSFHSQSKSCTNVLTSQNLKLFC